jgi:integrase
VARYLAEIPGRLRPETVIGKRKYLLRFVADLGHLPAEGVTGEDVSRWLGRRPTWGPSTRRLAGQVVLAFFRWAGKDLHGLKLPPPRSRGAEALVDPSDHETLFLAAPPAYRDALTVLYGTGCRPRELCRVEARYLKGDALTLVEHKADSTGRRRVVLLPPAALEVVLRLASIHPDGPLFRDTKGKPLSPDRLRNWVFKARRRLGLGRVMPYSYRHTFATDALAAGVPDAQVAELLGHSGTGMLHRHYSHLTARARELRGALEKVRPGE